MSKIFTTIRITFLCFLGLHAYSAEAFPPQTLSFAILIGNNRGDLTDQPLRYAQSDAERLRNTLVELGNFSPERSHLLLDQNVQQAKRVWLRVEQQIHQVRQQSPQTKIMLLFYYSGHADSQALHLNRSHLPFSQLRHWLQQSSAHVRLALLDTCRSGQLLGTKGVRRVSRQLPLPPNIRHTTTEGVAMITSSGVGEDSHELDQLRGSIFTHYVLSGLRGAADQDRDAQISLQELYSYVYRRTISHTVFLSQGVQHPSFRNELRGHGHLILTQLRKASTQLHFTPTTQGVYYLLNEDKTQVIAEVNKTKGRPLVLGLPPGNYVLVHRSPGSYRVQNLILQKGQKHELRLQQMASLTYLASAAKGMAWLTHPTDLRSVQSSPYRTAFYASLGIAVSSLVATGLFYGLSVKYLHDAQAKINAFHSNGQIDVPLAQTSQALYFSAMTSLGVMLGASSTATVFYIMERQRSAQRKRTTQMQSHPPSPPTSAQSFFLRGHAVSD